MIPWFLLSRSVCDWMTRLVKISIRFSNTPTGSVPKMSKACWMLFAVLFLVCLQRSWSQMHLPDLMQNADHGLSYDTGKQSTMWLLIYSNWRVQCKKRATPLVNFILAMGILFFTIENSMKKYVSSIEAKMM